nr:unnamed protein product [Naegleria fowleri]
MKREHSYGGMNDDEGSSFVNNHNNNDHARGYVNEITTTMIMMESFGDQEEIPSKKFKESLSSTTCPMMIADPTNEQKGFSSSVIMTTHYSHLLLPEIIFNIMKFLDERSRCLNCRLICSQFESAYVELSKIELLDLWNELNTLCIAPLNEDPPSQEEIEQVELRLNFKLSWQWRTFFSTTNGRPNWNSKLVHPSNVIYPIEEWDYASNVSLDFAHHQTFIDHEDFANNDTYICIGRLYHEKLLIMHKNTGMIYLTKSQQLEQLGLLKMWMSDLRTSIEPIRLFIKIFGSSELNVKHARECTTVEQALQLISKNPFYYTVLNKSLKRNVQIAKSLLPQNALLLDISFKKNKEFILQHLNESTLLFEHSVPELKRDIDLQRAFVFIAKTSNDHIRLNIYMNAILNQPETLVQETKQSLEFGE